MYQQYYTPADDLIYLIFIFEFKQLNELLSFIWINDREGWVNLIVNLSHYQLGTPDKDHVSGYWDTYSNVD